MPSVFDDPREVLAEPTWDELAARLETPDLSFSIGDADVVVPNGLLSCCRVVHQPHCERHIATSLVGAVFEIRLPDETIQLRRPPKQAHPGDVLARARDLYAAVEAVRLMAVATAEQQGGLLSRLDIDIWSLNLEEAEIWRFLQEKEAERLHELLQTADEMPEEAIEALPIVALASDDPFEVARIMAFESFRHVQAYAHRVLVLPSEIGHDEAARYITAVVWGEEGAVCPAAEAIVRDPREGPHEGPPQANETFVGTREASP